MITTYRYKIQLIYQYKNTLIEIGAKNLGSLIIDRDYDNKNSPVLILKASLDKNVIDDMILNSGKKTIKLNISKYVNNSTNGIIISEDYINEEFIYFLSNSLNHDKELDYSADTSDSTDILSEVSIGLVKVDLINKNKRLINDVFMNTSLINMVQKYTQNMNILIEPMNNTLVKRFIVPPLTSLTSFLKFTDQYYNLYKNSFRVFYDYNRSYLLSSLGISTLAKNETIKDIIINVDSTASPTSKVQGMDIDKVSNTCVININASDINVFDDKVTDISYNKIIAIGPKGNTKEVSLNLNNDKGKFEKVRIERMTNNNLDNLDNIKSDIENSSLYINMVKTELDTSILTINKSYTIKNFDNLASNNGKFLLARKREIFIPEDQNFVLTTILNFRKAIS